MKIQFKRPILLSCIIVFFTTGNAQSYLPLSGGTLTGQLTTPDLSVISGYINGFALGSGGTSQFIPQSNLNNLTSSGFYRGWGLINAPGNGWWFVQVEGHDNGSGSVAGWT